MYMRQRLDQNGVNIISREAVGAVSILLHSFQWKASGKSVLVQYKISMNSV